jgi:hypothetical protein
MIFTLFACWAALYFFAELVPRLKDVEAAIGSFSFAEFLYIFRIIRHNLFPFVSSTDLYFRSPSTLLPKIHTPGSLHVLFHFYSPQGVPNRVI